MAITFKKLSGDTEVIANPTLDGSETALSGLQIDGVKYAMGGSSGSIKMNEIESITVKTGDTVFGNVKLNGKIIMVCVNSFANSTFFYVNQAMNVNGYWYHPLDRLCTITGTSPRAHERKLYIVDKYGIGDFYAKIVNKSTTDFEATIYELVVE